jgi:hypothetical protein
MLDIKAIREILDAAEREEIPVVVRLIRADHTKGPSRTPKEDDD